MSKGLKILQIGLDNWSHQYEIPENMDWYFVCPRSSKALRKMIEIDTISRFQAVLIEDGNSLTDVLEFTNFFEPHGLFYNQDFKTTDPLLLDILKKQCAQPVDFSDPQAL